MSALGKAFPASAAQLRLWYAQQVNPDSCAYNLGQVFRLTGRLDYAALQAAVTSLVDRHTSLRTRFEENDGVPWQIVDDSWQGTVTVADRGEAEQFVRDVFARPFDLSGGPLL